jgi:putative transcriptional regulator
LCMSEVEIIKIQVDLSNPSTFPKGFVDESKLDATTEEQIMRQEKQDDLEREAL